MQLLYELVKSCIDVKDVVSVCWTIVMCAIAACWYCSKRLVMNCCNTGVMVRDVTHRYRDMTIGL